MNEPMSNESDPEWNVFILGLAQGNPRAFDEFWRRYGQRLEQVARKHFPAGLHRRMAPEDIVQSTCRSFFSRIVDGRLSVSDGESLWGLLCAITLNKTRMKQRFHLAQRRAMNRETNIQHSDADGTPKVFEHASEAEGPEEAAIFADQLEQVMELLDPLEREILQLKLDNYTHNEIAEKIHRSDRTIRRMVQRIQEKLTESLPAV